MPDLDPLRAAFRKSTRSDGGNGCVEAATLNHWHLVRDSKDPNGPTLAFTPTEWAAFLHKLKTGPSNPS